MNYLIFVRFICNLGWFGLCLSFLQSLQRRIFLMEKFFKLSQRGTDLRTEIMAGLTTFMTMAYVLAV